MTVPGALTRVARVVATAVWIFILYHAGAAVVAFSSDETRARLGPDAAPEDMGLKLLKGVERPAHLWRLR